MVEDDFKEALIEELTLLHDELGVPPRTIDMGKHGRFSPGLYSSEFGSWKEALERAGVEGEPRRPPDDAEVNLDDKRHEAVGRQQTEEDGYESVREEPEGTDGLDENQKLLLKNAERMDGIPAPEDLRRRGHSANGILEEHGTWEEALASVGIDVPENAGFAGANNRRSGRRDRLLEEVRKYEGVHGGMPTESDVEATEWMSAVGEYREEFGAVWRAVDAVRQERGDAGDTASDKDPQVRDELARELKLYYLRNGETPTREDVREDDTLSELSDYIDAFGDLRAAVDSASIPDGADEGDGDRDLSRDV